MRKSVLFRMLVLITMTVLLLFALASCSRRGQNEESVPETAASDPEEAKTQADETGKDDSESNKSDPEPEGIISPIRLLDCLGEVYVEDASGKSRPAKKDGIIESGEFLCTDEFSRASASIDPVKTVTLDEASRLQFKRENRSTELNLREGELLLDVREKLRENEILKVTASAMTVDIRGTIVFINDRGMEGDGAGRRTTLGVLEGTAQVSYTDTNGTSSTCPVSAGQKICLESLNEEVSAAPEISEILTQDISRFVADQIARDDELMRRVHPTEHQEDYEEMYPADGDWKWDGAITLVAQSASKLYDGTPLQRPSNVLIYGLPYVITASVEASGSQTNAGSHENAINRYAFYNQSGEDVTSHFTNIQTVSGILAVDPAPLTVWTGSAEKEYDGTPLVCNEAGLIPVASEGYGSETQPWQNTALVTLSPLGHESLCGLCGSVWVHVQNPLTGKTQETELRAGQKLTVSMLDEDKSLELSTESLTEERIPESVLRLYADNPDLLKKASEETGWDAEKIKSLIDNLPAAEENTTTVNGLTIAQGNEDRLLSLCAAANVCLDTEITDYNSRPFFGDELHFTAASVPEDVVVTANGSQTEIGESVNTYVIDWGVSDPANYILKEDLGTLKVSGSLITNTIILKSASCSKVYDGEPLTNPEVTVSGLPAGYRCSATIVGSQTDAGTSGNMVSGYTIFNSDGVDVTALCTSIVIQNGTLTVEPMELEANFEGGTVTYNGQNQSSEPKIMYLNGPHAGEISACNNELKNCTNQMYKEACLIPDDESFRTAVPYECTLYTGDTVLVLGAGGGADAGEYVLKGFAVVVSGKASNYNISCPDTKLTIMPAEISVSTVSAEKVYDGKPLTNPKAAIAGLIGDDEHEVTITAAGMITDAGSVENKYQIDWGTVSDKNYTIKKEALGTLTVKALELDVELGSRSVTYNSDYHGSEPKLIYENGAHAGEAAEYDGALTDELYGAYMEANPVPEGDEFEEAMPYGYRLYTGDTVLLLTAGGGFDVGEYVLKGVAVVTSGKTSNYRLTCPDGKLAITPAEISISTGSAEKVYDGTPLTNPAAEITGMMEYDRDMVTITAIGEITEVGSVENKYVIDWGNPEINLEKNYTIIKENLGTLTVKAADEG